MRISLSVPVLSQFGPIAEPPNSSGSYGFCMFTITLITQELTLKKGPYSLNRPRGTRASLVDRYHRTR